MTAVLVGSCRLTSKVAVAGGAVYVVYDSGLLGSSQQGTEVLGKAKTAIPPAINEWMKYFGMEVNRRARHAHGVDHERIMLFTSF